MALFAVVAAARRRPSGPPAAGSGSSRSSSLVWANIHGSFFLGPVVLGLAWLEDLHDRVPSAHRVLLVADRVGAGGLRHAVRPGGLGLRRSDCRRTRDVTAAHHASGSRPRSATSRACCSSARPSRSSRSSPDAAGRTPWPTLAWLGVFFVIGAYADRGIAWWPLGGGRRRSPACSWSSRRADDRAGARSVRRSMRRLNVVIAVMRSSSSASRCCRSGARSIPALDAPPGVVGSRRRGSPPRSARSPSPATGCSTRSRGDRGSSSRCRTLPVGDGLADRALPGEVWDDYEPGHRRRRRLAGAARRLGRDDRRRRRPTTRRFGDRLLAAGWQPVHDDADGTIMVLPVGRRQRRYQLAIRDLRGAGDRRAPGC